MDTPGKLLKRAREDRGKLLEDFSRLLKIRYDYLKAIEEENYHLIPGEVFIKGYMRSYANALGIDGNHILELYKKQTATSELINQPSTKEKTFFTPHFLKVRGFTYKHIRIIASVILIVLLSILFITYHKPQMEMVKKVEETLPATGEKPKMFSLEIVAIEETWISISVDKGKPEQRLLITGETLGWTAMEGFSIKIGNAGGVRLIFNGRDIGDLGPSGKVVRLILPEGS